MANASHDASKKAAQAGAAKTAPRKTKDGYEILATTHDGVDILKPTGKADHFTNKQARDAVRAVLARHAATKD